MGAGLRFGVFAMLALPALAQLDSSALRSKFGPPLTREVFHLPAGFDLTVDYGPSNRVCRIEVPALMPSDEKVLNSDVMKWRMYLFLAELVPPEMRGKELQKFAEQNGIASMLLSEYEHVSVIEASSGGQAFAKDHTIAIRFKYDDCGH